jgi:hypothetical protein
MGDDMIFRLVFNNFGISTKLYGKFDEFKTIAYKVTKGEKVGK